MAEYILVQDCVYCGGDGTVTTSGSNDGVPFSVDSPCGQCGGTGKRALGYVNMEPSLQAILDKCNEIKTKCGNIKDKLDATKDKCDQIWDKVKNL